MNKIAISTYLSVVTLNINELNAPNSVCRVAEGINKRKHIYAPTRNSLQI